MLQDKDLNLIRELSDSAFQVRKSLQKLHNQKIALLKKIITRSESSITDESIEEKDKIIMALNGVVTLEDRYLKMIQIKLSKFEEPIAQLKEAFNLISSIKNEKAVEIKDLSDEYIRELYAILLGVSQNLARMIRRIEEEKITIDNFLNYKGDITVETYEDFLKSYSYLLRQYEYQLSKGESMIQLTKRKATMLALSKKLESLMETLKRWPQLINNLPDERQEVTVIKIFNLGLGVLGLLDLTVGNTSEALLSISMVSFLSMLLLHKGGREKKDTSFRERYSH
jgi:hypothetical protein